MPVGALALEMRDISKWFPGVNALEGVSFDCAAGEVHAICGENGAGKSTLIKVLGGVYKPDTGTITVNGQRSVVRASGRGARAGISIIHQELSLLPHRTVAENVFLGLEPTRRGILDRNAMRAGTERLLQRLASKIDPDTMAGDLSVAEQQIVEIAKALAVDARILVMDEPTAALDDVDAGRLLSLVRKLREQGVAIVYISHRMSEIAGVADRITVMKDGRKVATANAADLPTDRIVRLMVGRDLADFYPPRSEQPPGRPLLAISGGRQSKGCGHRVDGLRGRDRRRRRPGRVRKDRAGARDIWRRAVRARRSSRWRESPQSAQPALGDRRRRRLSA